MENRMCFHLINTIKDIEIICNNEEYTEKQKIENVSFMLGLLHEVDIDKVLK